MAPTAERAILCGDPARALLLAQDLITEPRMSNHHRGLWGYFGTTAAGTELTVHATGIGSQSAVLVLGELAAAGVARAIRIGSCLSPGSELRLGSSIVAATARAGGGQGRELDPEMTRALVEGGAGPPHDLLSVERLPAGSAPGRLAHGATAADLQTAALAREAADRGVAFAAALVVAGSGSDALEDDPFEAEAVRLGRIAAEVLRTEAAG
jgi:hypothetical protein